MYLQRLHIICFMIFVGFAEVQSAQAAPYKVTTGVLKLLPDHLQNGIASLFRRFRQEPTTISARALNKAPTREGLERALLALKKTGDKIDEAPARQTLWDFQLKEFEFEKGNAQEAINGFRRFAEQNRKLGRNRLAETYDRIVSEKVFQQASVEKEFLRKASREVEELLGMPKTSKVYSWAELKDLRRQANSGRAIVVQATQDAARSSQLITNALQGAGAAGVVKITLDNQKSDDSLNRIPSGLSKKALEDASSHGASTGFSSK